MSCSNTRPGHSTAVGVAARPDKDTKLHPAHNYQAVNRTFDIGEKVYARNYGQGEKWLPAKTFKKKNLVHNCSL